MNRPSSSVTASCPWCGVPGTAFDFGSISYGERIVGICLACRGVNLTTAAGFLRATDDEVAGFSRDERIALFQAQTAVANFDSEQPELSRKIRREKPSE
jgi:hypothetical protein